MLGINLDKTNHQHPVKDDLDFNNFFRILKRHKLLIAFICVLFVVMITYNSITTHPIYESKATILVDSRRNAEMQQLFNDSRASSPTLNLNNEVAFLESRMLIEEVVKELADMGVQNSSYLFGTAEPIEPNFVGRIQRNISRWTSSLLKVDKPDEKSETDTNSTAASLDRNLDQSSTLKATINTSSRTLNMRNQPYLDAKVIRSLEQGEEVEVLLNKGDWMLVKAGDIVGWVASPYILLDKPVKNNTGEASYTLSESRMYFLSNRLKKWLTVEQDRNADLLTIRVQAPDPNEAAILTNTVAEVYLSQRLQGVRGDINQEKEFIRQQLETVEQKLRMAELNLKNYQENAEAVALDQSTTALVNKISDFQSEYDNARIELHAIEDRIKYLKSQLSTQEQQALDTLGTVTQPYVRALQDTLARAQVQLTMMQSDPSIGPNHPALESIKNRIEKFKEELRQKTQQMIQQGVEALDPISNSADIMRQILSDQSQTILLNVRLQQIGQLLDTYNRQMEQLPGKSLKLAQLQREQQLNEELYLLLHRRYEEARIEEAGQVGNLQIIDDATASFVPIKPNLKANILVGLILGLGLGIGLAFILGMTDTIIYSSEEVERLGARIIGRIPKSKNVRSKKQELQKGMGFPVKTNADAIFVESYRVIRTNLLFSGLESDIKTILITSPEPKDGKSVTAANLAITIAKAGKKVLLMDTDLRNPLLHRMFQISQKPGIAELLIHKSSLDVVIRSSGFDGLDIIPSGTLPPNSSELLGSQRLQEIIREIKQRYDRIIFDSPPVLAVADTMVLSALLGNTVLVIRPGKTKREAVQDSIRQITEVGGKLSGVILNAISRKNLGKYDKSYYYKNKNILNDNDNKAWERVINK